MFDPNAKLEIKCPNGHPVPVTLAEGRRSAMVTCPSCQAVIEIDGTQFDRELKKAEKQLKDFGKRISRGR